MRKTIIFDFDGTIADSIPSNAEVLKIFNQIADENSFKNITLKEIEALRDVDLYESIKLLKIPIFKIPFLAKRIRQVIRIDENVSKPIKNMPEALQNLKKQKFSLGIMTSNKKETVEKFLNTHNLNFFDFIYSGRNLFGKDKVLKSLFKKQKINIAEVIYVGDEIRDVNATKKIGLSIIAVTWGYNSKKGLSKLNPEYLIENPFEIEKIVAKFFKK